jgi:hypothetical protein
MSRQAADEPKSSPRITALRQLAAEAELERRDFLYEATEQLRRFIDANRERLREIGPIKLTDDEQDYLVYHPVDETWTTRLTYQDPADGEWYDEEQIVDAVSEICELYNPADIYAWFMESARDPISHLPAADELEAEEDVDSHAATAEDDTWERGLPPRQQETLAAQRLWQLADTFRGQIQAQQKQVLHEFVMNAEEVLRQTGDLILLDEAEDALVLRTDGRFETSLDLSDLPAGSAQPIEARREGLTVTDGRVIADYYDPSDVLTWVTEALSDRYPGVVFSAVYE